MSGFTWKFADGTEKSYTRDELDAIARERISKSILEEVNLKGSARVGYHAEQILNRKQFSVEPNILSKIEAKIVQDKRYISRPYFKSQGDYEILKNPNYRHDLWHEFKIAIITGIITLAVGIALWLLQNQSEDRKYEQLEKRIDSVSYRLDSLTK
jgi:hypothetical protein